MLAIYSALIVIPEKHLSVVNLRRYNVNFDRFEAQLQVVDAHTVGEFCRVVIGGFPEPEGNTMIEKKKWMEHNYDHVRTASVSYTHLLHYF